MAKSKPLTCPNCGANISSVDVSTPTVTCPQCKQVITNPLYDKGKDSIVNVIPQDYDRKQFLLKIVEDLENDDKVEALSIDQIPDAKIHMFYVLVYYYNCSYQAPWSGIYFWKEDQGYKDSDGYNVFIKRQQYINGNAMGQKEMLFCDISKADQKKLPQIVIDKALEVCSSGPSEGMVQKHLSELNSEEKKHLGKPNPEEVWNEKALPTLKDFALAEAQSQMDTAVHGDSLQALSKITNLITNRTGISNKNIQFMYQIDNQEVGYVPFIYAEYKLDGKAFYSVAKADKELTGLYCDSPSDHEAEEFVKAHKDMLEDEEQNAGCSSSLIGLGVAAVLYFFLNDTDSAWLIALGVGALVGFIYYKNRQKKLDVRNEEAKLHNQPIKEELNNYLSAKATDRKQRAENARKRIMQQ